MKNEKGITLIALVITIIILLIISAATIMTFKDDGGLLSVIERQKNEALQSSIKQEIDIAIEKVKLDNAGNNLTIQELTNQLLEKLQKDDASCTIELSGEEQYIVKYKENTITYYYSKSVGKIEIVQDIQTARNTLSVGNQNGIETGPISVTINFGKTDLQKRYKIGTDGEWQYTGNQTVDIDNIIDNITIIAEYVNGSTSIGHKEYKVSNVDNISPNAFSISANKSTNSIIVTQPNVLDTANVGSTSGISGISKIQYRRDNGEGVWQNWQDSNEFTGLTTGTYQVQAKAIDRAGNETISSIWSEGLNTVPVTDILISQSPTTARNTTTGTALNGIARGPISINITYGNSSYTHQYKIGSGDWTTVEGNASFTVTENTSIYARYYDGTNGFLGDNLNVQNVDNIAPVFTTYDAVLSGSTITASGTATDTALDSTGNLAGNGIAGIAKYQYSIDGTTYQDENTFTITSAGTYTVYIKAIDNAGNEKVETKQVTVSGYSITLNKGTGISSVTGSGSIVNGEAKAITATVQSGYEFYKWQITSGTGTLADQYSESTTITTTGNITVQAVAYAVQSNVVSYANGARVTYVTPTPYATTSSDMVSINGGYTGVGTPSANGTNTFWRNGNGWNTQGCVENDSSLNISYHDTGVAKAAQSSTTIRTTSTSVQCTIIINPRAYYENIAYKQFTMKTCYLAAANSDGNVGTYRIYVSNSTDTSVATNPNHSSWQLVTSGSLTSDGILTQVYTGNVNFRFIKIEAYTRNKSYMELAAIKIFE